MSNQKHTISFRIDDEQARQLDDARKPFGLSRHEWSRGVLLAWLNNSEDVELNQQLIALQDELSSLEPELDRKLSRLLFALLTVGHGLTPVEAKATVEELFEC